MQRAGGVALFPEARDERMRRLPSARGCHARSRSGPQPVSPEAKRSRRRRCPSRGAKPSKMRRVAQDCDPMAYMYTPSISPEAVGRIAKRALAGCCKDALIGRLSRASTVAPTVTARCQANQQQAPISICHPTRSKAPLAMDGAADDGEGGGNGDGEGEDDREERALRDD